MPRWIENASSAATVTLTKKTSKYSFLWRSAFSCRKRSGSNQPTDSARGPQKTKKFELCDRDHAPAYMKGNPFILSGYRVNFSLRLCVASLFKIHNETANIWSHLLLFPLFALLLLWCLHSIWETDQDLFILSIYVGCCLFGMIASVLFHLFSSHSEETCKNLLRLDLSGVTAIICSSFLPPLYYGLRVVPFLQRTYICIILVCWALGVLGPLWPPFNTPRFRYLRVATYGTIAVFSVVPTLHGAYLIGPEDLVVSLLWKLAQSWACYLMSLFHYITRFPESWKPGKCDRWFQSHTFWHLWGGLGAIIHFYSSWCVYRNRDVFYLR